MYDDGDNDALIHKLVLTTTFLFPLLFLAPIHLQYYQVWQPDRKNLMYKSKFIVCTLIGIAVTLKKG